MRADDACASFDRQGRSVDCVCDALRCPGCGRRRDPRSRCRPSERPRGQPSKPRPGRPVSGRPPADGTASRRPRSPPRASTATALPPSGAPAAEGRGRPRPAAPTEIRPTPPPTPGSSGEPAAVGRAPSPPRSAGVAGHQAALPPASATAQRAVAVPRAGRVADALRSTGLLPPAAPFDSTEGAIAPSRSLRRPSPLAFLGWPAYGERGAPGTGLGVHRRGSGAVGRQDSAASTPAPSPRRAGRR